MTDRNLFSGIEPDPAGDAGHTEHPPRVGFFTDTSVCIGCKACEVACKEWNA
ncbi:4Fe-4S ferredoxin, partial [Streptomyces sp. NPDC056728]